MGSLTPTSETSENVFLFAFIPSFASFEICNYVQYFFVRFFTRLASKQCTHQTMWARVVVQEIPKNLTSDIYFKLLFQVNKEKKLQKMFS